MRVVASLALIAALLLSACAGVARAPEPANHTPVAPAAEKAQVAGAAALDDGNRERAPEPADHTPVASAAETAQVAGAAALHDGNYERALEQFGLSWKESPDNPAVSRDFVAALEGLKKSGDEASRQGLPEEAGKKWMAALRYIGHPAAKGKALSFSRADVKSSVDRLSSGMMEKGLKEYQTGNLEAAIDIWRSILAYDPGNLDAAKSVKTTTTQLENLKKVPPAPK